MIESKYIEYKCVNGNCGYHISLPATYGGVDDYRCPKCMTIGHFAPVVHVPKPAHA